MKRFFLLGFLSSFLAVNHGYSQEVPETKISNGIIDAKVYLPDSEEGYYRGPRFDWSGVIPELTFEGHSYFGQWFEKYDPTSHDAIMGPVDVFSPLDYDSVKPGAAFVKIGVGVLKKHDESPYSFNGKYEILHHGEWKVEETASQIEFIHTLDANEYVYEYKKTIELVEGQPIMLIKHRLKNRGKRAIETDVYNHNFFVIDNNPVGPGWEVEFPFSISTDDLINEELTIIEGNKIRFVNELKEQQFVFYNLKGFSDGYEDYDIHIKNWQTGAAVRIIGDKPLSKLAFWSSNRTLAPEPYIQVKIESGETFSWDIAYEFYLLEKR